MRQQRTVKEFEHGGLYLVATPIGNLQDMTFRAVETLQNVDYILAEDTRVTKKLCDHFTIQKPIISCHEHNQYELIPKIIADVQNGKNLALVSDAGMPCISDPGSIIVEALIKADLPFTIIPGASAGVSLFAISGMSQNSTFIFHGFLPTKLAIKQKILENYREIAQPVIFYESPHRIAKTLAILPAIFTEETKVCIARELTKMFETLTWLQVGELAEVDTATLDTWKGEIALIIAPSVQIVTVTLADGCAKIAEYIVDGVIPKQAIKQVAKELNLNKNELYKTWEAKK
jgi:probable S-adenosylmethionine-dependent methyltransferase, YraL family